MPLTVLAFGTFDGLHAGHRYFLSEAAKCAEKLVVAVARDEHVFLLKQKHPKHSEQQRLAEIASLPIVSRALLSDRELGSYALLEIVRPDIIAIGHDQIDLMQDLQKHTQIPMMQISKFER